ncbi:MAG: protein-tyrosine-phosphatase [Bacteroidia bacterium]
MYQKIIQKIESLQLLNIAGERKAHLQGLINYINNKIESHQAVNLNFICTHNSRRSQFAQIWGRTLANYYGLPVNCFSGGIETTALNHRVAQSLLKSGFKIEKDKNEINPVYRIYFSDTSAPVEAFSKMYNDAANKSDLFAAIMVCDHADENCPLIPGAEFRFPLFYRDPKEYDNSTQEAEKYDACSEQIASELSYIFSKIYSKIKNIIDDSDAANYPKMK